MNLADILKANPPFAKTRVERAIEPDEATAMTWINQQLEASGVGLT